jgi:hypothetical protein
MIRHIHFNRWKPDTAPETIDKAFEMLADFPARFPEIKAMELHRDAGLGKSKTGIQNFDFAIILDFDDESAFRTYMAREHHHQIVQTYIKPYQEAAARMQFIVDDAA